MMMKMHEAEWGLTAAAGSGDLKPVIMLGRLKTGCEQIDVAATVLSLGHGSDSWSSASYLISQNIHSPFNLASTGAFLCPFLH